MRETLLTYESISVRKKGQQAQHELASHNIKSCFLIQNGHNCQIFGIHFYSNSDM